MVDCKGSLTSRSESEHNRPPCLPYVHVHSQYETLDLDNPRTDRSGCRDSSVDGRTGAPVGLRSLIGEVRPRVRTEGLVFAVRRLQLRSRWDRSGTEIGSFRCLRVKQI